MIQKFDWEWNVPKEINIGQLCSSIHLGTEFENKLAMIVENDELGTDQISFKELAKKTDQFAQCLINLGLQSEDRVLIRLPNSLDYPISFLGAMKAGYVSVPTSTLLTAEEVVYLANDSQATALVTDKSMWKSLQEHTLPPQLKYIFLTGAGDIEKSDKFDIFDMHQEIDKIKTIDFSVNTKANDPAYLVYTSGTTGYPKGVLHAHRAIIGRKPASQYWFDFKGENDRIVHSGKFNWTYVLGSGLMDPLHLGKTIVVYEGKNHADTWMKLIKKHNATIFIGVPTIYRQILQKTDFKAEDVPSLRYCMSAGEHLSDEVLNQWRDRFDQDIFEAVGMSEFSYYLSENKYNPIRPGSAGFPQPGHDIKLMNPETLQEVNTGEEGMICVPDSDPGLFLRYWNLPEETDKHLHSGWFFTGDYAKYDEDGYIWFLGRKDDIIKSFGYRVSPYEIERVFKSHPDVADCAAIGEEIEKDKLLVVTYILPHEGKQPDP
ncbi:acyl-CoA synthetase, partial [Methylophilaceae bacterium]|nr:acyl-CoA synthetase [Methylophilaceae bacterium]